MNKTKAENSVAVNETERILAAHNEAALAKVEANRPAAEALAKSFKEAGCSGVGITERFATIDVWYEGLPKNVDPLDVIATAGANVNFASARSFHQAAAPHRMYLENVVVINPTEKK